MITAENLTKRYQQHVAVDDVSFTCEPGHRHRFPRAERGRQVDHPANAHRAHPADVGSGADRRPLLCRLAQPGQADRGDAGRGCPAPGPHRTGDPEDHHPTPGPAAVQGSGDARAGRAWPPPASVGWATTRWACGSDSASRSALIGDPAILVLDEPANGMDPEGIRWMRELLRDFASRGGTVLLSSHLLGEVQATVDRLVVIGSGRIVADGSLDELLTGGRTVVRGLDNDTLAGALRAAGHQVAHGGRRADRRRHQRTGRTDRRCRRAGAARTPGRRRRRTGGPVLLAHQLGRATAGASGMTRPASTSTEPSTAAEERRTVMSTALTSSHATPPTPTTAATAIRPQRLSTVFLVELRKLIDTRSGKAIVGIGVAIPLIALTWLLIKGTGVRSVVACLQPVHAGAEPHDPADRTVRDDRGVDPTDRADHLHPLAASRSGAGDEVRGVVRHVDGRHGRGGRV